MSINVTVSGNPVKIHKGKMVTASDTYQSKSDFDKRRLMRLQQVRQQSKDIAENVRNKVKKEKEKQMNEIEKDGKQKLKSWQNRKLLELQTQYKEALDEIGMGHKEADDVVLEEIEDKLERQRSSERAAEREQVAQRSLENEKAVKDAEKQAIKNRKSQVKSMEASRVSRMANIKRNSPKKIVSSKVKKPSSTNISITVPQGTGTSNSTCGDNLDDVFVSDGGLPDIPEESDDISISSCDQDVAKAQPKILMDQCNQFPSKTTQNHSNEVHQASIGVQCSNVETEPPPLARAPCGPEYYDSRISDRIKRRTIMASQPDYCDTIAADNPPLLQTSTKVRDAIITRNLNNDISCDCARAGYTYCSCCCKNLEPIALQLSKAHCPCSKENYTYCNCCGKKTDNIAQTSKPTNISKTEIPQKPKINLKNADLPVSKSTASLDSNKVSYYEHTNKYEGKSLQEISVDKIGLNDIEIDPGLPTEREYREKMKQRDKEAQDRAKKALEREKVQKDYREMMQKLPLLQKQERLAKLHTDRPEYHMNEERLKELERKKQNHLENAYIKSFPNLEPKVVTLNSKKDKSDVRRRQERDSSGKDVGSWTMNQNQSQLFSAEEVQHMINAMSESTYRDRKSQFKELLRSLDMQKKQLIEEIKKLPRDESVIQMLRDLNDLDESEEAPKKKSKNKGRSSKPKKQTTQTEESESDKLLSKQRPRYPKNVLVLQNISTQTSPKPVKDKVLQVGPEETEKDTAPKEKSEDKIMCPKLHTPCGCKEAEVEPVKILIKINDGKEVEIQDGKVITEPLKITSLKPEEEKPAKPPPKPVVEKPLVKSPRKKSPTKPIKPISHKVLPKDKSLSWRDTFNKTSTSSTSYFSPPELSQASNESLYDLRRKPQQRNSESRTKRLETSSDEDVNIQALVERLLSVPRFVMDNLGVSSSSVTTPDQSVVEIETNIPPNPVHELLKQIIKTRPEVLENLSTSQDKDVTQESILNGSCDVPICPQNESSTVVDCRTNCAQQYAEITNTTSKKIENLAAMIQKLREERNQIIGGQTSGPPDSNKSIEKDSTVYFDINNSSTAKSSSTASGKDEASMNKLLEIDMDLAKKLRKFKEDELQMQKDEPVANDDELLKRLHSLVNSPPEKLKAEKSVQNDTDKDPPFMMNSILANIPKLPKFLPLEDTKKKPPPSKGLIVAKRFNQNISGFPHELSAIQEGESHVSTKTEFMDLKSTSDSTLKKSSISTTTDSSLEEVKKVMEQSNKSGTTSKTISTLGSSSSDDIESIEAMLKSIGMEWAIPTLHKTKEALALCSSSTDSEPGQKSGRANTKRDSNLVNYLRQQLIKKISSSTLASNTSNSLLGEFSDLSSIHSKSQEKTEQRTSTPVQRKVSLVQAFSGDSDLSSVRNVSDEKAESKKMDHLSFHSLEAS
ncbi:nucleolar protein dao-5 isoform X3 [Aethina tumida]|uniref:nucleolar protein dao-5 isoform X3 n=1 Tax=Aethina tumida TaxID=116153 RepID=UPI00214747D8|nr:nucleolar protein dao-5 isoform X3 [Aethina tumida]